MSSAAGWWVKTRSMFWVPGFSMEQYLGCLGLGMVCGFGGQEGQVFCVMCTRAVCAWRWGLCFSWRVATAARQLAALQDSVVSFHLRVAIHQSCVLLDVGPQRARAP